MHKSFSRGRLRPFFSKFGNSSSRALIASVASHRFTSLISNIKVLGQNSQYLEIFRLVDNLPLDAILEAVINDSRTQRNVTKSKSKSKPVPILDAFPFLFDALLNAKSQKVLDMIEFTKKNVSLADQIGSKKLFYACCMLHSIEKKTVLENESVEKTSSARHDGNLSRQSSRNIIETIFVPHYTQWLLGMDSAQRNHHTVNLLCYKHDMLDRSFYFTNQLEYIRRLTDNSAVQTEHTHDAYSTSLGDVVISGFTAARMFHKPEIGIQRLLRSSMSSENFTKEAFSLAVTGCTSGKIFENESKNSNFPVTKRLLDALSLACYGNSFHCILLRDVLLQVLQSRGCSTLVIDYASKFKKEGLLLGSRGWNVLISAHVNNRDFDSAKAVLVNLDFEEDFVRNTGPKVFSTLPSEDAFKFYEDTMAERKSSQSSTHVDKGGQRGLGRNSSYNSNGEFVEDIYSFRRKKYNNLFAGISNRETEYRSKYVRNDMNGPRTGDRDYQNPITTAFNLEFDALLRNNTVRIPEFGVNIHTFASLIFSPFLNIQSRNYYAPNKHDLLPDGTKATSFFTKTEVAANVATLLDIMIAKKVQTDIRFMSKVLQIGKSTGSTAIIFKVLHLARSAYYVQDKWNARKHAKLYGQNASNPGLEIIADFQNSDLFNKELPDRIVEVIDMSNFYESAIEAKMMHNDIQTCELLLREMVDSQLTPTPTTSKLIMGYYLKTKRYSEVLHMFEMVPVWGGDRTYIHGSFVISALTLMGRLADAWRGAESLHAANKYLSHDTAIELFSALVNSIAPPKEATKSNYPPPKRKLSKKSQISAVAILSLSLLRFYPLPSEKAKADMTRKILTDSILYVGATDMDAAAEILHCAQEKALAEGLAIGTEWVESIKILLVEAAQAAQQEEEEAAQAAQREEEAIIEEEEAAQAAQREEEVVIEDEESIECPQSL